MRRSTPGLVHHDAEVARELAALLALDPARVIAVLEPLVGDARRERLLAVLARRLDGVAVLIDRPYDPFNAAALARTCESFGIARLHIVPRRGDAFLVSRK